MTASRPVSLLQTPQLGGGMTGNDVDLFDDWLVRRHTHKSVSNPCLAEMRRVSVKNLNLLAL